MQSINMKTFASKLTSKEKVWLLDIRKESAYQKWAVVGYNLYTINIPFQELEERIEEVLQHFPLEKQIFILCDKGEIAHKAASLLDNAGYLHTQFVEGGIGRWGEYVEPVKIGDLSNGGAIYQFIRYDKGCLSYMIVSSNEALVVDPARIIEPYLAFAKKNGWKIKAVADTHLHADHISGGRELAKCTGAGYWFPCRDGGGIRVPFNRLEDGLRIPIGSGKEAVFSFSSPGHTLGSMSLLVDDYYFLCGDCLFVDGVGRPDLPEKAGDWAWDLRTTIYDQFKKLPEDLVVLPGHFSNFKELDAKGSVQATLKELYSKEQFSQLEPEEAFFTAIINNPPKQPECCQDIRRINIGLHLISQEKQQEIESNLRYANNEPII